MPMNLRMSNNPSRRSVAPTYVLKKNQSREYHTIRNSMVKSLSNMKIKVTISQGCKTTRHAIKTFPTKIQYYTFDTVNSKCNALTIRT